MRSPQINEKAPVWPWRWNLPEKAHEALKRQARKKFGTITSERARKYIYGTLQKIEKRKRGK